MDDNQALAMVRHCGTGGGADSAQANCERFTESVNDQEQWWQTVGQYAAEPPAWTRLYDKTRTGMKIGDMIESKYLKQSDVDEEITVTVNALKKVNVARDDEDPEYRWTVKFAELPKPMVLNVTNLKRMAKALGDDTDDWLGKQIILYVDPDIEFGGNVVGGLRLKGLPRPKTAAKPRMNDDDFNREMSGDVPF